MLRTLIAMFLCTYLLYNMNLVRSETTERMLLLQISEELALLAQLISDRRVTMDIASIDTSKSEQFDYYTLESDLVVMRQAILQHLSAPSRLPRILNR